MRLGCVGNTHLATLTAIFHSILSPLILHDALLFIPSFFLEHETIYTLIKLRIEYTRAIITDLMGGEHATEEPGLARLGLRMVLLRLLPGLLYQQCSFKLVFHQAGAQ